MRLLTKMWEGLCGGLMGRALGNNTHEKVGDRAEQRERSHCDAVAKAASANPAGSSGPGMFFESPQMEVKRPELCTPSLTSHPVDCLQGEGITLGEAAKGNTPGRNLTMNPRKTALWQLQE